MAGANGRGQQPVPGVEARTGKFPGPSLIPKLTAIQREHGWLPREELVRLSRDERRPLYEIEGLISFYPHFRTELPRKVELTVCQDLSCWLHGGEERLAEVERIVLELEPARADAQDRAAGAGGHPRSESVPALPTSDVGLKGSLHRRSRCGEAARATRRASIDKPSRRHAHAAKGVLFHRAKPGWGAGSRHLSTAVEIAVEIRKKPCSERLSDTVVPRFFKH